MDPTIAGTVIAQVTTFKDSALEQFNAIVPIALGLVITVAIVYFAIRSFRGLTHV